MSASAIVMMVVAMLIIWGGLALAVTSLVRHGAVEQRAENVRRAGHRRGPVSW
ncbi:methionine/alanine import family NSS transporter small subunit [Blastococcus sp. MG754426]|uniref:methionine/alanine import family NSS transporter small subunit n=1 Tax=Blastococcus sp. MG754426 TaxID=2570317 RepID=UPI001F1B5E0F|nr:methionine/alanine import family NSS transporter small subunit [Blastococcus sp. MG754426]MCF6505978.1 methionine/alanine import family NSS transporter small subunit [Blastococcus sp. MG754426]